jgi:hypothetical protein
MKTIVDCSTGTQTNVEMTAEEVAEREAAAEQAETLRQAQEAADTKQAEDKASGDAKLKALGLTDDEIAAR